MAIVLASVRGGEGAFGYNALTGEYEDLIVAGIIDPTKVTRSALQNAASIAGLLLTSETVVIEQPEETPPPPAHVRRQEGRHVLGLGFTVTRAGNSL